MSRFACPVTVAFLLLTSSSSPSAGLDVQISDRGAISASCDGQKLINYEMLQLVDTASGWRGVFHYGQSGTPQRTGDDAALTIAETLPKVLSYVKRISIGESELAWDLSYEVAEKTGASRNNYFVDIPKEALAGALYTVCTADTEKVVGEVPTRGTQQSLKGVVELSFLTPKYQIELALGGENVTWLFTDWTASMHKSYRLRIEHALDGKPLKASLSVKMRVTPSSSDQVEAARRKIREEAEARRQASLVERGFHLDRPLRIGKIRANAEQVPQYGKLELTFPLEGTFTNPFDPAQIDVVAEFRAPSGKQVTMPAFFCQGFSRSEEGIQRVDEPVWKVRYAPVDVGTYSYRVVAKNEGREDRSPSGSFECTARKHPGYIRISKANPLYCEFENGRPYVPSGINVFVFARLGEGIPPNRLATCERWLDKLADHEGNFIRLRMDSWWLTIEMTPDEACDYLGLGYYHQQTCWEVDRLYDKAAERGIYVMHCLDNANGNVNASKQSWRQAYDLYLKQNGGVCDRPVEFWSQPEARRYVRNKLRYCVARWGYHPNLMSWEFWNEVSCRPHMIDDGIAWHRDMARYLRTVDPYAHPITTSLMGDHALAKRIWALPEMEIMQHHYYSRDEMVPHTTRMTRELVEPFNKPFFLGEYGVAPNFRPGKCDYDKTGIHLHNGMWAALFGRGCGAGAMWYISSYVEAFDLWFHYRALARFADRVPWNAPDFVPCQVDVPTFASLPKQLHYSDLNIPTSSKYAFKQSPQTDFVIQPDGTVENWQMLRPQLNVAKDRKSPPTFYVNLDRPAQFVMKVSMSVGNDTNRLLAHLDDERVVDEPFPASKEANPKSEYVEQYDNWRTPYDKAAVIDVPAGQHSIRCEAVGKDRLELVYQLRGAIAFERTYPLRAFGFRTSRSAYLWFQNRSSTWWTAWEGKEPTPLTGMTTKVRDLPDGVYRIDWYDTWAGRVLSTTEATSADGALAIVLPTVTRDLACIVTSRAARE